MGNLTPLEQELINAIKKNDRAKVQKIIATIQDAQKKHLEEFIGSVNCVDDKFGMSPLHLAAMNGFPALVKMLIDAGAQVDFRELVDRYTPLMCTARYGYFECIRILLKAKAQVNIQARSYSMGKWDSALSLAAEGGYVKCVQELIDAGAIITADVLYAAVIGGRAECVEILIKKRPEVAKEVASNGDIPLIKAAERGDDACIKKLLEAGAIANQVSRNHQRTALIEAAAKEHLSCVSALLKAGADVHKECCCWYSRLDFASALGYAIKNDRLGSVRLLLPYYSSQDITRIRKRMRKRFLSESMNELLKNYLKQKKIPRTFLSKFTSTEKLNELYQQDKIKFPATKGDIQQVLQDYVNGADEVFNYLQKYNPGSFENKGIWIEQLKLIISESLRNKKPHSDFFLRLLSVMSENNKAMKSIIELIRTYKQYNHLIPIFYANNWMPLPTNTDEFRNLLRSCDCEQCHNAVLSFLKTNSQQLNNYWNDQTTLLSDFLWELSEKGKESLFLFLLAKVDPNNQRLQAEINSWRKDIVYLSKQENCCENPAFVEPLNNLILLYDNDGMPVIQTEDELRSCLMDYRYAAQYSRDPSPIYRFLLDCFSFEKEMLLANVDDNSLERIFTEKIHSYPENQRSYFNLLKALKPGWWQIKIRQLGEQGEGITLGGQFEARIENEIALLPRREELTEKERRLNESLKDEAGGVETVPFKEERPQAFIEAVTLLQSSGQFTCPITQQVIYDPVVVKNKMFERSALIRFYNERVANGETTIYLPGTGIPFALADINIKVSEEMRVVIWRAANYSEEEKAALPGQSYLRIQVGLADADGRIKLPVPETDEAEAEEEERSEQGTSDTEESSYQEETESESEEDSEYEEMRGKGAKREWALLL